MPIESAQYADWIERFDRMTSADVEAARLFASTLGSARTFDVLMPVHDPPVRFLIEAIASVRRQIYTHWRLCIADDGSSNVEVHRVLQDAARDDPRISVDFSPENGGIAWASNRAFALGSGDFVAFMDHDDVLAPDALLVFADRLDRFGDANLIYSDFDRIDEEGCRIKPFFKPDYDHEYHLGLNMVTHLTAYRRDLVERLGGLREGYPGSEDYDLSLRTVAAVPHHTIHHVPFVLYHWRVVPSSFSKTRLIEAINAAKKAVTEHCNGMGVDITMNGTPRSIIWNRVRAIPDASIRTTIAVTGGTPAEHVRNRAGQDVEISKVDAAADTAGWRNNVLSSAGTELVAYVDAGLAPRRADWLDEMISHFAFDGCAAVGARILGPDDRVVHSGLLMGVGGSPEGAIASSAFSGVSDREANYFGRAEISHRVAAVSGGVLVVRKRALEEIGGFDPNLRSPLALDIDVCMSLRARGYHVVLCPHAVFDDQRGGRPCPPPEPASIERLRERWGEAIESDPYYSPNLSGTSPDFSLAYAPRVKRPWS